jgi:mRNA-degrading endonuclease YafQ of YafQ-DinJ toxin-antitoxin module
MTWELRFTESYLKREVRFLRRHPDVKRQYGKTLELLEANPHHASLRLHALAGKLEGLHSISINLSYRITLELRIQGRTVIPVNVGSHDDVYG